MKLATVLVCVAVACVGIAVALRASGSGRVATPAATPYCAPFNAELTQSNVEFLTARVQRDPQSSLDLNSLSAAYLQRSRETGDISDALRAAQAAQRSLAIRTRRNAVGYNALSRALLTQHRFREALAAARRADQIEPYAESAGYLACEIMIESGDYGAVRRELPKAYLTLKNPQGLALWARLEEIQGSPEHALGLLSQASAMVDHDVDALPQTVAWFHMRRGNLLAMMGRADEAMAQYGEAVALYPTDYRTMTSMARLCAGRGQWTETLAWAKRSAGIVPTPEILGLERDALHALGREVDAKNVDATIAAVGQIESSQGTAYDRMRALYNAEHGIDTAGAVSLAGGELRERHDVYAYDTLAWCLYRNGQAAEARRTMAKALAIGTKDAVIYYHAGMIALSNGDRSGAKSYLGLALRVNPYFLPFAPDSARKVLGTLV